MDRGEPTHERLGVLGDEEVSTRPLTADEARSLRAHAGELVTKAALGLLAAGGGVVLMVRSGLAFPLWVVAAAVCALGTFFCVGLASDARRVYRDLGCGFVI